MERKLIDWPSDIRAAAARVSNHIRCTPVMTTKLPSGIAVELKLEQLLSERKIKRKDKWLYYTGKMSEEQLRFHGWEPFDLTILKTDVDRFIESDTDIIRLSAKITLQEEAVNYLESVVKLISNRQWNIRAALDWIKFTQGA